MWKELPQLALLPAVLWLAPLSAPDVAVAPEVGESRSWFVGGATRPRGGDISGVLLTRGAPALLP